MATKKPKVSYFCMEYGLESDFNIYSGGLGILAGDHLKTAKDQGESIIGLGILWKQGYHKQEIGKDGRPRNAYPIYEYDFLKETGIKVKVKIRQRDVYCKVWKVDCFNNVDLYLLDTDLPENGGGDSWITGQLYGWFGEERIAQEMVLGIGGVKALRKLDIETDVYHFNEGHAVFAGIELIREKMEEEGMSYEEAVEATQEEIVFTTHTPIKQGNEEHPHHRLRYMGANQNLTTEQMVALGGAPFNMTVAALKLARNANGVAQLHKETAREMWKHVDKAAPQIEGITNGVHRPTWVDERMVNAFKDGSTEKVWNSHQDVKRDLIDYVEEQNGVTLDEDKLLIGFARRAAPYKRSNLIFTKPEVIDKYLEDGKIQIIFSGKAHPLDDTGKEIVERLVEMTEEYPESVVFIEDYDMTTGKMLTRGCDVWLNNPRRPKEASGTSGMKAAMNGVLNVSILDGWWPEACRHGENGWAIGTEPKTAQDFTGTYDERVEKLDEYDLKNLYDVLLDEVLPTYYEQQDKWVKMMTESHDDTYEKFSAKRMLEHYYELMYAPAE
ncbi:alpha-glucan phosphorylase [Halobacteroides halobius DSM 5150]|uniref:glycogen phosphorylase n=1 Tax=Halobacteroides halobius (strain ATCC 35273 / DSM 5150 / MD-1) TaxID=748449 RepID=L0KA89_HALHC|nr:alpha-glucan family phosphorylase [Halobacteroides halobius]AGB42222.1 alpha-glucan phosphorylase [Halobacteroides halobius DSM 5150]